MAGVSIFLGSFFLVERTQIIQIKSTIITMNITTPAIPPAIYANSERSKHRGPVNEPEHRHDGVPFKSLTHVPPLSQ